MSNYICFDLGTTKIKSSLLNDRGRIIYLSSTPAKTHYDNGVYQKAEEYLETVLKEINTIQEKHYGEFKKTKCLICSGQMAGILGIDANWDVVFPWTYSLDSRFGVYVDKIDKKIGELVRLRSGGYPFGAGKILWIKSDFPEIYAKIKKFINLTTYVAGKICNLGVESAFIDYSCLTLWGLADTVKSKWDSEICNILNIDLKLLPVICKPYEIVGSISKNTYGTENDINVMVGCGDQVAGFIGSGVINQMEIVDVAGTYTVLGYCTSEFKSDLKNKVFSAIYSGIEEIFYQIAVVTAGGYTYNWFIEKFNYKPNIKFEDHNGSKGLYFIPYIGGRYHPVQPYYDGTWVGINWQHTLDDFYTSILESFGYEFNFYMDFLVELNNLDLDSLKEIKVIGGGAKDNFWNNIKANILNLNYLKMNNIPFEIMGLYLISKYGDGLKEGFKKLEKDQIIYLEEKVFPQKEKVSFYELYKDNYKKIIQDLGKVYYAMKK
jgi:xylulokinase